jgi:WD40 repeat protein
MAQVWRNRRPIAAALSTLAALIFAPALAQDQGPKNGTDLYDRPVLAVDPGMHTAKITSLAVDAGGQFAVTGSDDRTVRIWSVADGKLLRTIWIPVGPDNVGAVYAVAISPDGSTIAAGGWTERNNNGPYPVYIFDRASGDLLRRIDGDLPDVTHFLTFSPDGRYLAATLGYREGLRVFDRDKDWSQAFRDDQYGDQSYGAAFTRDGHLATSSLDGVISFYQYDPNSDSADFRGVGELFETSGKRPWGVAYSPDGKLLAVGHFDVAAVDVLDGFERVGGHKPADVQARPGGTAFVAWSRDGQTLFAAGAVEDAQGRGLLFAWDRGGLGGENRMTYCAPDTAAGVDIMPNGRILVAASLPCLGLMNADGQPVWTVGSPISDFRSEVDTLKASFDGSLVDFVYGDLTNAHATPADTKLRFDLRSLTLSIPPQNDDLTFAPLREGLTIDGWRNGTSPTLSARPIPLNPDDVARSVAIAPDAKRFFLGSAFYLTAFDDIGTPRWRWQSRNEVLAVNATKDGRIVVAADGDGAIRWHRADDGRELLTLQVLRNGKEPAKWDWVLWTPEGFYEATPGAEDVLKWVVNHGPDKAATTLPVSAIAKLHRPNALPHVLDQLETAHALGVDDISQARFDVQAATGSAKPPGGMLHVLAIGIDTFGDKAGGLHLDYAAEDAHDVAAALLDSQRGGPGKASLYADVDLQYLPNDKADSAAILDTLDAMAQSMAKSGSDQNVAVILVSSHGEMIDGQFYLIPYGFDAGSQGRGIKSAVSASEFAKKVEAFAAHGKVLLLLDACHSGAVGAQGWATDPDAKVLQDAMDLENVSVLTSSKKNELSEELPEWRHGALAKAFLDALTGAADPQGIVKLSALTEAMENEVQSLTKGRQHLGMHINFSGSLFVASHY